MTILSRRGERDACDPAGSRCQQNLPPRASLAPSAQHFYENQTGSILMGRKCPPPAHGANL